MSVELTKSQWQVLGYRLKRVGFSIESFVRTYENTADGAPRDSVVLTERESSCQFKISQPGGNLYRIDMVIPGTSRRTSLSSLLWPEIADRFETWASELKKENEATDPWGSEAEEMASDDSYFTIVELPHVDKAIDDSLSDLHDKAIEHGVDKAQIAADLSEIKAILKKTARVSTKREWLTLFKGIIIEKLMDWGMQTAIFHTVLNTLITSAQDIQQLAEHAVRYLPQ